MLSASRQDTFSRILSKRMTHQESEKVQCKVLLKCAVPWAAFPGPQ